MSLQEAEVIVVGAGPAGTAAAFFLAREGVRVLLVDQAAFPRDKICGDGLTPKSAQVLARMGLADWLASPCFVEFRQVLLSSPGGHVVCPRLPQQEEIHGYVVPRLALDAALVERAVAAGAQLCERTQITGLERPSAPHVRLTGQAGGRDVVLEAPLVIAADGGAASFTGRLGLAPRAAEWVAVRAYVEGDIGVRDQIEIHWEKSVLPAYGWVFPLGDGRANVGIGAYSAVVRRRHLNLSAMLRTFLAQNQHARARLPAPNLLGAVRGYPLRADADRVTPVADHVLVAGEAAGLVNPLTGEGIGPSLACGELAASFARQALAHGDLSARGLAAYGRAFHAQFDPVHRPARLLRWLLSYRWLVDRAIRRASHDCQYAQLLLDVILGIRSPAAALRPATVLRMLRG